MTNPEDIKKETQSQEAEKSPSELHQERLTQINHDLCDFNQRTKTPKAIRQMQESRQQEYDSKMAELEQGLGTNLSPESKKMIRQNMVDSAIEQAQRDNETFDNLQRLKKAAETLSPEDFLYFEKILGNREGRLDQLYNLSNKAFHTTNDFNFKKILESGNIRTDAGQEGMYGSNGASFTDGNFPETATFQTIYEDQNTHSTDKKFNSQNYGDKAENFIRYFWDNKQEETRQYLSKISGGKKVETFEDALKIAEGFRFKAKPKELENDSEALSKLYGVTVVFEKDKLPDLTKEGTEGLQKDFELRSYRQGGVPLSEASTVFVPEAQIENMKRTLQECGLDHIQIRPSEELETIRMVKLLEKKPKEVKIESTRSYESSSAIAELSKFKVIYESQITPETKVCLIGDGQGMDTKQFLLMGVKPENIKSINYEQSEVEQANTEVLQNTGVEMKQGDATSFESLEKSGLTENSQEVITLMHVLEVPNIKGGTEKKLASNIVKLLKPNGELIVSQYKHKFTKDERNLQRQIGIEEITAKNLQKQFGDDWRDKFKGEYDLEWEQGMRYGEISNVRTKEELIALFEQDFDIKIEENESEYILKMKKK